MDFIKRLLPLIRIRANARVKSMLDDFCVCQSIATIGASLLHCSVAYSNAEVTQYLLEKGCNANAQDSLGRTPLMLALAKQYHPVIELLLQAGSDFSSVLNHNNKSALQIVCEDHQLSCNIRHILLQGFRSTCSSSEEAAKKLIDAGCHLYQTVYTKDSQVVEYLLERGYSTDSMIPKAKITALHAAVFLEDVESVRVLLKYGADVKATDMMGYSPLYYVYRTTKNKHSAEKVNILRLLMSRNDSPTDISQLIPTLLHGDSHSIRVVLSRLDFIAKDESNDSEVLHYLAFNRNPGLINELKMHSNKCNVNAINKKGLSPLIVAAMNSNFDMLKFLLDHGATVDYVDYSTGYTAICYAFVMSLVRNQDQCHQRIIELLLQHGADAQCIAVSRTVKQLTIFDVMLNSKRGSSKSLKSVVAHLAVLEGIGTPITEIIREKISSCRKLKIYYEKCRRLLTEKITGSVTLLKLLTSSQRNLERYAANKDLVLKLERISNKLDVRSTFPYYFNTLMKRFPRNIQRSRLINQAAGTICTIFENRIDQTHIVVSQLSDYLDDHDLRHLAEV